MKKSFTLLLSCTLALFFFSCELNGPDPDDASSIDEALHLSFKTPDWGQKIDCTDLDLPYYALNAQTHYTYATSASTRNTFFFSYPKDSSAMVAPGTLKKYSVQDLGNHATPFQFSMRVPVVETSNIFLISQQGLSDNSFNEIMAVKYAGASGKEAFFQIKGRYKMQMVEANTTSAPRSVSGTYHIKVKTTRL